VPIPYLDKSFGQAEGLTYNAQSLHDGKHRQHRHLLPESGKLE
jgi:hypothetical protein